jgi:RNA polymerase sigma-70 factor (ECF subfamily)
MATEHVVLDAANTDWETPPGETPSDRLARWVRDHAAAVRGYLIGVVRRPDLADDLLQETFQRAWQARDRYEDRGTDRAFLLRIADRLAIDHCRRSHREINVDEATWQKVEPAADNQSPLDELRTSESNQDVAAALDRLTVNQRRVLLLRYFSDMPFEQIAVELECPLGTALSHCRRGLQALRKLLTTNEQ